MAHHWTSGCWLGLDFDGLGSHRHGFGNWLIIVITTDANGIISNVTIIEVSSTYLLVHERLNLMDAFHMGRAYTITCQFGNAYKLLYDKSAS